MHPRPDTPAHRQKRMHHIVDAALLVTERHDGLYRQPRSGMTCKPDAMPTPPPSQAALPAIGVRA